MFALCFFLFFWQREEFHFYVVIVDGWERQIGMNLKNELVECIEFSGWAKVVCNTLIWNFFSNRASESPFIGLNKIYISKKRFACYPDKRVFFFYFLQIRYMELVIIMLKSKTK